MALRVGMEYTLSLENFVYFWQSSTLGHYTQQTKKYGQYICETYNSRPKQEDGCEESNTSDIMTLMDILLIVIFGVCLPTWDVYSDIGLAITLIQPKCYTPPTALAYGIRHNLIGGKGT